MENEELEAIFKKLAPKTNRENASIPPPEDKLKVPRFLQYTKRILPFGIAIVFLLLAFQKNAPAASVSQSPREHLLALVPMIAIPKGEGIPNSILRVVAIDPKLLSKIQLQGILLEHDLAGLAEKIRAKRTLAPGRPIFWKDLELEKKNTQSVKPSVTYAKENL